MLDRIKAMIANYKASKASKAEFRQWLVEACRDGVLAPGEVDAVRAKLAEVDLTESEWSSIRIEAFLVAAEHVQADGAVSQNEMADLRNLQLSLGIPDSDIAPTARNLVRLQILSDVAEGRLQGISVPGIVLKRGEEAYWSEWAELLEERVVDRRYVGGSSGFSVRIVKGVTYRFGGTRGRVITERGVVPVSRGRLVVTSQRLSFLGDRKSFNVPFQRLLAVEPANDGLLITCDKERVRTLRYCYSGNEELLAAVISASINKYGG